MKLIYWAAKCRGDSDAYSIVTRTKKEAVALLKGREDEFGPVVKRTITYKDAFDLFDWVTSEGGGRSCGDTDKEGDYD